MSSPSSHSVSISQAVSTTTIQLTVNGRTHTLRVEPRRTLLDALREDLHLTGACTVVLDGEAVYSCLALAVECQHQAITTIEGLAQDGQLDPVQQAFVDHDALQCGFCTPGQVLALKSLLLRDPHPDDDAIERAMAGNLCRCGAYPKILAAARSLAGRPS
jgi:xanthine dehydrogenase YagT iron-sulfur-binding subunit